MKEVQKSALKRYEGKGLIIELNEGITCNIFNHFTGQYLKKDILKHERDMIMETLFDELFAIVDSFRNDKPTHEVFTSNHPYKYIEQHLINSFKEPLNDSRGIVVLVSVDGFFYIQDTLFNRPIGVELTEKEMFFVMDELTRSSMELVEDKDYKQKIEKYLKNHRTD